MGLEKRVLVVEDDRFILQLFKLILQRKGYVVDTVQTGNEALRKLSNQSYAVALIDISLPDMVGLDLLKCIPAATKKIIVTGDDSEDYQRRAQAEGADAYLLKPVHPEELLQTMTH